MRALVFLGVLVGCPEPVDQLPPTAEVGTPGAPGEVPPPPAGEVPPPPEGGATPAEGAAIAGAEPGAPLGVPADGMPPAPIDITTRTLASLANGGATVKIRGTLVGATTAQVDFTAVNEEDGRFVPELLQALQVTGGAFEVEAPAHFDRAIYVTAVSDAKGDGITPDDPGGFVKAPLELKGADLTVVVTVAADGTWAKEVPWYTNGPPGGAMGEGPPPTVVGGSVAPPPGAEPLPIPAP